MPYFEDGPGETTARSRLGAIDGSQYRELATWLREIAHKVPLATAAEGN
jgi:hypothetical protein